MLARTLTLFALGNLFLSSPSALAAPLLEVPNQVAPLEPRGFTGRMTWFHPGLGACGGTDGDGSMIIAISMHKFDKKQHCGKSVTIKANGRSVSARITDACPTTSCPPNAIDVSPAVFQQLVPKGLGVGVLDVEWEFAGGSSGSGSKAKPAPPAKAKAKPKPKPAPKKADPKKDKKKSSGKKSEADDD